MWASDLAQDDVEAQWGVGTVPLVATPAGMEKSLLGMTDVVVTVPKGLWLDWLDEGDLPGDEWTELRSHFWIRPDSIPDIAPGERVYIVAHGRLRGYAPLVCVEKRCSMAYSRACLMRYGGAVAVTIPTPIRGFRGWMYRFWNLNEEIPFPNWMEVVS